MKNSSQNFLSQPNSNKKGSYLLELGWLKQTYFFDISWKILDEIFWVNPIPTKKGHIYWNWVDSSRLFWVNLDPIKKVHSCWNWVDFSKLILWGVMFVENGITIIVRKLFYFVHYYSLHLGSFPTPQTFPSKTFHLFS